jgi:aminopeptidase N
MINKSNKIFRCCILLAAFFLLGCSKIRFIEFEPVYVRANALGVNVYRGSYEKLTDIIHTNLDVSFNWDSAFVYGVAEITAQPYFYPSNKLVLDGKGFKIHTVQLKKDQNYLDLNYIYLNNKIQIDLDQTYKKGEKYTIKIAYTAMPQKLKVGKDIPSPDDRGLYFINAKGNGKGPQQIWTQGETESNSAWFPTIENPAEKMTHHFNITVDQKFKTLSNGTLKNSTLNKDGTRTDSWEMNQSHSVYLSMLAVGDFAITKDSWRGKEVNYYTEHEYAKSAKKVFGNTPKMLEFFSTILDYPYPWEKYDQIVVRNFVSGAMENTTASVFYDRLNMTIEEHEDNDQDDIIAHELIHHWFGNLVTCESWANLPLNESFATYGEYLWREHNKGIDDADYHLMQNASQYFRYAKQRDEKVIRFDYAEKGQMFDPISYQKGALILHTLRKEIEDEAFFKSLNYYLKKHAYQSVEIHDLRLSFEEITGRDLNWFFNQWFLASGFPQLKVEKYKDDIHKEMVLKIIQTQDTSITPIYHLPLNVKLIEGEYIQEKKILLTEMNQEFRFPFKENTPYLKIDYSSQPLVKFSEEKQEEDYFLQFKYADHFFDRFESIKYFNQHKESVYANDILQKSLLDKGWANVYVGLINFKFFEEDFKEKQFELIKDIALHHPKSIIRAEAVKVLKKYYAREKTKEIFHEKRSDPSLLVQKALK